MFIQHAYERQSESMTLNNTYRLTLPASGLLGSLFLEFYGTEVSGYGQSGGNWRLIDEISKIEIIGNGSTVIKSITGKQAQALAVFDQGVMPPTPHRNYAANIQRETVLINFGRWLYDSEYGLDLARFTSVELRVTNTGSVSSFSNIYMSIMKVLLRDAPSGTFKGFIRSEEWFTWTTVANQWKYLIMPTEHLIRRMVLQAIPDTDDTTKISNTGIYNLMDDIRLSFDTGAVQVWEGDLLALLRLNYYNNGRPLVSTGINYNFADKGYDVGLGWVFGGANGSGSIDGSGSGTVPTILGSNNNNTQANESYEADSPIQFIYHGLGPFNCALLEPVQSVDPGDWLDPNRRKDVLLNIHTKNDSGAADGTNAVVLDRLVTP